LATVSRKDAILDAARTEFADRGYSGARIERIAAAAVANKQLIFHYFGSKDGLYAAAAAATFRAAPLPPQGTASPTESLRRFVAEIALWFAGTPGAALLASECGAGRPVPEEAERTVTGWIQQATAGIKSAIDDGQRKGYFRDDVDAQYVAALIVGSAVGSALLDHRARSGISSDSIAKFASLLAQVAVDLCAWR
jgi:TetR/AcrR family transcriptional regulator